MGGFRGENRHRRYIRKYKMTEKRRKEKKKRIEKKQIFFNTDTEITEAGFRFSIAKTKTTTILQQNEIIIPLALVMFRRRVLFVSKTSRHSSTNNRSRVSINRQFSFFIHHRLPVSLLLGKWSYPKVCACFVLSCRPAFLFNLSCVWNFLWWWWFYCCSCCFVVVLFFGGGGFIVVPVVSLLFFSLVVVVLLLFLLFRCCCFSLVVVVLLLFLLFRCCSFRI